LFDCILLWYPVSVLRGHLAGLGVGWNSSIGKIYHCEWVEWRKCKRLQRAENRYLWPLRTPQWRFIPFRISLAERRFVKAVEIGGRISSQNFLLQKSYSCLTASPFMVLSSKSQFRFFGGLVYKSPGDLLSWIYWRPRPRQSNRHSLRGASKYLHFTLRNWRSGRNVVLVASS